MLLLTDKLKSIVCSNRPVA